MKKTVYLCDRCGAECQPVKVRQADATGGVAITDGKRFFSDVCLSCLSGLYALMVVTATPISSADWRS